MSRHSFILFILLGIVLISSACSPVRNLILRGGANYNIELDYPTLKTTDRGDLLKYELVNTLSVEEIKDIFPRKKGINHEPYAKYDVELYRIYYSSENLGNSVVLSGMIGVPMIENRDALPHYQYHHGTLLPVDLPLGPVGTDAPSLCDGGIGKGKMQQFEMKILGLLPASNGYFISLPDYAGYSISKNEEHPYGIAQELGQQSVDMIRASKTFAKEKSIALNDDLFISGWSEGGYVALATHKLIEEKHPEWNIKCTAALAGPYNFVRFIEYILDKKKTMFLPLYNWAFYSAFNYADTNIDKKDVWKYDVNNQLDALATPYNRIGWVYKKKFRKDFTHNPNNEFRTYAIEHLNIHEGWTPKAPIHFFTGTEDEIVPSFNTMDAYEGLKKAGGEVYYHPFEGESHLTPTQDFVTEMLDIFNE